jgi:hypothetical protein
VVSLALITIAPLTLHAQDRDLYWPAFAVNAHLDAEGVLHVREQQVMRFEGDWNGGQRSFNLRLGQSLVLESLTRIDSAGGAERPLARGSLSAVDEFDWAKDHTLRWRSRLPSDPPFRGEVITYVLTYTLSNILVPQEDGSFVLDHDFAFVDREGRFAEFALELTIDPAWKLPDGFTGRFAASDLPPGRGFVVTVPLTYLRAERPAGVEFGASASTRFALQVALLVALFVLLGRLYARERALGRFAALTPQREITRKWLDAYVFNHLPEVAGAAWDDSTSAPEVAAILARLVQEKKLSSSVETEGVWIFRKEILHLKLEVDRKQLQEHERALIGVLFESHDDTTDTGRVRARYRSKGFDPSLVIRPRLEQIVELTTPGPEGTAPTKHTTLMLLGGTAVLMGLTALRRPADMAVGPLAMVACLPAYFLALALANQWQRRVSDLVLGALTFLIPLGVMVAAFIVLLLVEGQFRLGPWVLAGLTCWVLALSNSALNAASSRQSPERIAMRKRLTSARRFFRAQLSSERPQLLDAWFPYLIAFGLGPSMDRWFRAFGGVMAGGTSSMIGSPDLSSTSSGGGGWTGFGGGGGFSGGGSSASFAAAVGGMAASVPSPSSGGSGGGGGGGGGSSGGGGGGGW